MKTNKRPYEAPIFEIAEIAVEQGIAQTGNSVEDLDWNDELDW